MSILNAGLLPGLSSSEIDFPIRFLITFDSSLPEKRPQFNSFATKILSIVPFIGIIPLCITKSPVDTLRKVHILHPSDFPKMMEALHHRKIAHVVQACALVILHILSYISRPHPLVIFGLSSAFSLASVVIYSFYKDYQVYRATREAIPDNMLRQGFIIYR